MHFPVAALGLNRPWPTAAKHFTIADDGLKKEWSGRVWLNPPYGRDTIKWMARMAMHGRGTALVFARTETEMFFRYVWPIATAVYFIKGRLPFHDTRGELTRSRSVAPSILIAYSKYDAERLSDCCYPGKLIQLSEAGSEAAA